MQVRTRAVLQASPDLKGIKTLKDDDLICCDRLQASPDLKGIKTVPRRNQGVFPLASSQP